MDQFLQRLAGQGADVRGFHGDHLVVGAGLLQDVEQRLGIGRGMGHDAGGQCAISGPGQFLAQRVALRAGQRGRDQDQLPFAGPGVLRGEVDAAIGVLEAAPAGRGQAVETLASELFRYQPFLLRQAIDAGAHHALVEAERLHQPDEAAKPDGAAVRRDEVAIDRDDQRVGAARVLIEEILDPLVEISALHVVPIRTIGGARQGCARPDACASRCILLDAPVSGMPHKTILM